MLLAMALVLASPQKGLDRLVVDWCSTHSTDRHRSCLRRQRRALINFIALRPPRNTLDPIETQCLRKGASAPSVDWVAAYNCLEWLRIGRYALNVLP